jgi:hypothetical protein
LQNIKIIFSLKVIRSNLRCLFKSLTASLKPLPSTMLPFNTSAFSNTSGAPDRAAQRKAVVAPFDEFDAKLENVQQHIAQFTQRCEETGLIEDFSFIACENAPPPDVGLSDPIEKAAWISDPQRLTLGNILIDAWTTTMKKVQAA